MSAAELQACRWCGCTEEDPCDDGCFWVAPNLCSNCDVSDLPPPPSAVPTFREHVVPRQVA